MAKTRWYWASQSPQLTTTRTANNLIGDVFEEGEPNEYTVLKIVGGITVRAGTLSAEQHNAFGISVVHEDLAGTELPDPNVAPNLNDDEGFWMWKWACQFADDEDLLRLPEIPFEINTRRVVREPENLSLINVADAGTSDFYFWARTLVLIE